MRLQTRNLLDCTAQYPEAQGVSEALTGAYQAILDGEIVALDERGVPSFQRLQPRMHPRDESAVRKLRKSTPVVYEVFDILWVDGQDVRTQPLRDRQKLLDEVLTPMGAIRRSEQFVGSGTALFKAAQEQGLEGIVAKRLDAPYVTARSAAWLKIKAFRTMECVIGGWTEGQGGRSATLGALLLGVYKDGELSPVGHVGTGFDDRTLKELHATLKEREVQRSPFAAEPRVNSPAHWCQPELVCEVRYAELTREGTLRHPSYRGLRADVDPRECIGEERRESTKSALRAAAKAATERPAGDGAVAAAKGPRVPAVLTIDGQTIRLTNLEKVLFPEDGYTKADLIRYYTEVSPYLLPVIRDRPLTL
ncbi:MAG: non-homologous end-joining DNA ligase, partial [Chloroflexota bacterium]